VIAFQPVDLAALFALFQAQQAEAAGAVFIR
jgi:hypothetical protein